MSTVTLVPLSKYQDMQWDGIVEDMACLIEDGLDCRENFIRHHANKRGVDLADAKAALIQLREGL